MRNAQALALPLFLIAIGIGWLLTTLNVIPDVNWVWIVGLAVGGALVLLIGGVDKLTLVLGPFLLIASLFSVLRQTDRIPLNVEMPSLMILLGVLIFIAHIVPVRAPKWLVEQRPRK